MRRLFILALSCLTLGAVTADLAARAGWRLIRPGEIAAEAIRAGEDQAKLDALDADGGP